MLQVQEIDCAASQDHPQVVCSDQRRCVLHIGLEKTGSTSIQHCLAANRDALARLGILVPFSAGHTNHLRLVTACMDFGVMDNIKADQLARAKLSEQAYREQFLVQFDQELSIGEGTSSRDTGCSAAPLIWHTLVLSSELISSRLVTDQEIDRLLSWIAKYTDSIDIVVFLRRQDRLAVSRFSSNLRAGLSNVDGIFANECGRLFTSAPPERPCDDARNFYDYNRLLARFERAAARSPVTVRIQPQLYDALTGSSDTLNTFLATLGLARGDLPHSQGMARHNPGLSGAAQHAIAVVNAALAYQLPDGTINPVRRQIIRRIEARAAGQRRAIARDVAKAFYQRFAASNEAVHRRYFPQTACLFQEDFASYPAALDPNEEANQERLGQELAREHMQAALWLRVNTQALALLQSVRRRVWLAGLRSAWRGLRQGASACKRRMSGLSHRTAWLAIRLRSFLSVTNGVQSGDALSGKAPCFTLIRILGNDLPPRQAKGQMLNNLRTILEQEPAFLNCTKVFVLNRLFDKREEDEARRLIEAAGHTVLLRSFCAQVYADCPLDTSAFAGLARTPRRTTYAALAKQRCHLYLGLCAAKIRYAFDINGARNQALDYGRRCSDWSLVLDGACFVSADAAQRLFKDVRQRPHQPYLIIPMTRMVSQHGLSKISSKAHWREEPQIAFHSSSKAVFDERFIYGQRDKTSLLTALGVPGPWLHWRRAGPDPFDKPVERFRFNYASASVFRLPSMLGSAPLEATDAAPRRHASRSRAILAAIAHLDRACNVPIERRLCRQIASAHSNALAAQESARP